MNRLLEDRLDALRTTLDQLSSTIDENLQTLLLNLTCDPAVTKSTPKPIDELARAVREKCLEFMIREHPMAHDLKFALATLRVGQDYERMGEISLTLNKRVEFLRHTAFQDICKDMTGVMADVLNMNKLVQNTWKREHRTLIAPTQAQVAKLAEQVAAAISAIQMRILEGIALANGNAEAYVELVLACRHLKRVAGLMASVPDEMVSFS